MRNLMFLAALTACEGTATLTDPPTDTDIEDTDDTDVVGCGDTAPVVASFAVSNGSAAQGATGPSILLEMSFTDADGDLAPAIDVGVFWDTTIDGAIDSNSNVFLLELQAPPDAVECETNAVAAGAPVALADIMDANNMAIPFNTSVEWQILVTDNDGKVANDLDGHTGVSSVVVACTPMSDGSDGTCP